MKTYRTLKDAGLDRAPWETKPRKPAGFIEVLAITFCTAAIYVFAIFFFALGGA